jgi:hypothetical protein
MLCRAGDGPTAFDEYREIPMAELEPVADADAEDADVEVEAESQTDDPVVYENRAARRAKGKSAAQPPPHGKGQRPGGRGSVQSPRQWGNRRSG